MNKYEANPRVNFFDGANGIMTSILANYVPRPSQLLTSPYILSGPRIRWRCRVRIMVRKERIPSWMNMCFGFELAGELLGEEDGGDDDDDEVGDGKEGWKGIES